LSIQQANEAAGSRGAKAKNLWAAAPRPHLVSTAEARATSELVNRTAEASVAFGLPETSRDALDFRGWSESLARRARGAYARTPAQVAIKRLLDVVGTIVLAVVFAPLMLVICMLVPRSGGSVIYKHRRVGRDGTSFECLKFRTMVPNAEQVLTALLESDPRAKAEWVRDHKLRNDPRVTRVGRFLRRTSLDELPQLWNVMRGEMSLVGPRPVVREELLRYGKNVGAYLAAKPGITGLWQVNGRNNTDYRRRVVLDTYYVRNQGLLLDLFILLKTTRVIFDGSGAY
jgi:Undecaprenyl-phosphate galactose phosphotransferase WbaP